MNPRALLRDLPGNPDGLRAKLRKPRHPGRDAIHFHDISARREMRQRHPARDDFPGLNIAKGLDEMLPAKVECQKGPRLVVQVGAEFHGTDLNARREPERFPGVLHRRVDDQRLAPGWLDFGGSRTQPRLTGCRREVAKKKLRM